MVLFKGKLGTQAEVAAKVLVGAAVKGCVHYANKLLELYCDPRLCLASNANCCKGLVDSEGKKMKANCEILRCSENSMIPYIRILKGCTLVFGQELILRVYGGKRINYTFSDSNTNIILYVIFYSKVQVRGSSS